MSITKPQRLVGLLVVGAVAIAGAVWWLYGRGNSAMPNSNSILVIAPYDYAGTWVFDDPAVDLVKEPFVAGIPEMIDDLVKDIPDAKTGFRLLFSAQPFPGHQKVLTWTRSDGTGNYYQLDDPPMEGWICPALFKYYETPPQKLYVKAEAKKR
ncbi:MAG TPA: DUF6717 family protein [Planctomycetaceae bacterium]|nr:DUF6717 family protein [Planctomycetaceae bacterium]